MKANRGCVPPAKAVALATAGRYTNTVMKNYELTIVVDGNATSAKKKASVEKVEKLVKTLEGKVLETLDWGTRELAYPMRKLTSGAYFVMQLELPAKSAGQVNERLRLEEDILRYLLVTPDKHVVRIKNRQKEAAASS